MKKFKNPLLPYNIQFFGENDSSGNDNSGQNNNDDSSNNNDNNDDSNNDDSQNNDNKEKTFTQSEVTKMLTREKKQGKRSVLKELGFSDEDEAKKAISLLNTLLDSQKDDKDKANDKNGKLKTEKDEAEKRAQLAEAKLTCLENGVNKDSLEDVLSIAMPKLEDDEELEDVIKNMKKEKRYLSFFEDADSNNSNGTGNPPRNNRRDGGGSEAGEIGKRLAGSYGKAPKKSSFFD